MDEDSAPMMLTLPNDLRLLSVARSFIESICQTGGIERTITDAIVLACYEAASNVIRHAHRDTPSAQLEIICRYLTEGLEVRLNDEGDPFDVSEVPHMDPGEIRVGGRGVFLMRSLMDELTCERRGERGNSLRMFKRCQCQLPEHGAS